MDAVIGKKAIHMMEPEERKASVPLDKLYIDIGAKDKKDANVFFVSEECYPQTIDVLKS